LPRRKQLQCQRSGSLISYALQIYLSFTVFKHLILICLTACLFPHALFASDVDSLRTASVDAESSDTLRILAYWTLSRHKEVQEAEALSGLDNAEELCKKQANFRWLADNELRRATYYYYKGEYPAAIAYIEKAVVICRENGLDRLLGVTLKNLGILQRRVGNYLAATDALLEAKKLYTAMADSAELADTYNSLGNLYQDRRELGTALEYLLLCENMHQLRGDSLGLASVYINLGNVSSTSMDKVAALQYYNQAKSLQVALTGSPYCSTIINIGSLFLAIDELDSATLYLDSGFAMSMAEQNAYAISVSQNNRSSLQTKLGNYDLAVEHASEAFRLAETNNLLEESANACHHLERAYLKMGNYEMAYEWAETKYTRRDSLINAEQIRASTRADMQHDFEKVLLADSIAGARENEIDAAELAGEKAEKRALWGGFGAVLVLAALVYRGYRRKKNDNELILVEKKKAETQTLLVEEKNKEILDSINYAKRLQDAILPLPKFMEEHLHESFVMYLPKDIVAGDFYWMEVIDNNVYLAAADCTGHGVPGAMVSVVCSNALNKAVIEQKITDPGAILDRTRSLVSEHFGKGEDEVKDGMDISFCVLNLNNKTMKWAGANNPLWLIRKGELLEYKANKQPIGKVDVPTPFTTHNISLESGDTFYLFTDGFSDQFGGDKGKKLKSVNFKKMLSTLQSKNMKEQHSLLLKSFSDWRGGLEQLDDVCVIGVRV
jgi:serine phosphatase RsbU (regulator of sigma subunit)